MDVFAIFFMLIVGGIMAFAIGLLAVGLVAILIDGYKQAKMFGLMVTFVGTIGFASWAIGGLFVLIGNGNNILWGIISYTFVLFIFAAISSEGYNIIQWWKKQWPEVYGQK